MSINSSQIPEGEPHCCPTCGRTAAFEPSYTGGDSPCPHCGHLLWWFRDQLERMFGLDPEQVFLESAFMDELGTDSLDRVELNMEIEKEFGVAIPDDQAEQIRTVADAIRYIEGLRSQMA